MAKAVIIDTSVIASAMKAAEVHHAEADAFISELKAKNVDVFVPATALWEIGAAMNHPAKRQPGAQINQSFSLPVKAIAVNEPLFQKTFKPHSLPLKAADHIFISCALDTGYPLVTFDYGMKANASQLGVPVFTPSEFLAKYKL
jgi:predicted nucleic acid-binding protein